MIGYDKIAISIWHFACMSTKKCSQALKKTMTKSVHIQYLA